jgi:predicted transcriptional regulator
MGRVKEPAAQRLLDALKQKDRRRILKLAVESDTPLSPSLASKRLPAPLSSTARNFKVLATAGLIALSSEVARRGAMEHFYVPTEDALNHPIVQAVLMCM